MQLLRSLVIGFADVILFLLLGRAVCSWIARPGSTAYRLYQVFVSLTEPVVAPCRKITSRYITGTFDFSVLLAFLLVSFARSLLLTMLK